MNRCHTLGNNFCFPYIPRNSDVLSNASRGFKLQTHLEYRTPTPLSICFRSLGRFKPSSIQEGKEAMYGQKTVNQYIFRDRFEFFDGKEQSL